MTTAAEALAAALCEFGRSRQVPEDYAEDITHALAASGFTIVPADRLAEAYRWIAQEHPVIAEEWERPIYDNACGECLPDGGNLVVEGFQCVPHRASAYLATAGTGEGP